jgi:hypothetical protein
MGVYQYTLRKDFKKVGGILGNVMVARYGFAYRHSGYTYSSLDFQRTVARLTSLGLKAQEAAQKAGIKYVVTGDWKRLEGGYCMEVRDASARMPSEYTEDLGYKSFPLVGYLMKLGNKLVIMDQPPKSKWA